MEFKLTISTKDGQSGQVTVKEDHAKPFLGKVLGESIKGEPLGFTGYEFLIAGGSDFCGFPMRRDIPGQIRKKILAVSGIGLKAKRQGQRQRKTLCGNTIHAKISQINLKVTKEGAEKIAFEKVEKKEKKK